MAGLGEISAQYRNATDGRANAQKAKEQLADGMSNLREALSESGVLKCSDKDIITAVFGKKSEGKNVNAIVGGG
jgi:hypothetical protein